MTDFIPINEDPKYDAIWEEAKKLLPEWLPWEFETPPKKSSGWWGLGMLGSLSRGPFSQVEVDPEKYYFWLSSQKSQGLGTVSAGMKFEELKANAIGFLLYVANEERKLND